MCASPRAGTAQSVQEVTGGLSSDSGGWGIAGQLAPSALSLPGTSGKQRGGVHLLGVSLARGQQAFLGGARWSVLFRVCRSLS